MATARPDRSLVSSSDVEGTSVYGTDRDNVGTIDHLMIDRVSGHVRYAVISFGGLLGLGESHHPLPWSALRYDTTLGGYVTSVSEQELRNAPHYSDASWSDRTWESQVHQHYRARPYWDVRPTV